MLRVFTLPIMVMVDSEANAGIFVFQSARIVRCALRGSLNVQLFKMAWSCTDRTNTDITNPHWFVIRRQEKIGLVMQFC